VYRREGKEASRQEVYTELSQSCSPAYTDKHVPNFLSTAQ